MPVGCCLLSVAHSLPSTLLMLFFFVFSVIFSPFILCGKSILNTTHYRSVATRKQRNYLRVLCLINRHCLPIAHRLLLIAHCPLLIAYYSLPIAHCLLPIAHCLLPIAHCPLPIAHCLLPIALCLLPFAHCLVLIANCQLPIAHCP